MASTRQIGELGERIAEAFLKIKGYQLVKRNYRYAGREIDLLVKKGCILVAVEVKLRRGSRFGAAAEAVDARKLERIRTALQGLLSAACKALTPRIDLVVVDFAEDEREMLVTHIEGVS
ncbi:MAG: YraN family protein [Candidatus Latescibacteria bacterium]|nr:YraN family protein [Candidatus Latescibacterota bacterium]NIM66491.1 YraN family protein [Candidatus Latescibacterota bacterium]NIO02971.1 YraN family protein [Candidatus Latescibacterota bacterium]NIO30106.1 YraN family protein [Candidatus Latescibacterota bacterium]NIO57725.1 YraN family protein [Candidatus Latescibacterota bacterium]